MTYDFDLTEQRAYHPGAEVTSALASIARNAAYGARENARLVALHTQWWQSNHYVNGFPSAAITIVGQSMSTFYTWSTLYRGHIRVPSYAKRFRVRSILGLWLADSLIIQPRITAYDGSVYSRTPIRSVPSSDLTVNASNVGTATLAVGHGIASGAAIYTEGFTANVGDSVPSIVTDVTDTTITFAISATAGSKGSGAIRIRDMFEFDTARNDENGGIIGPMFGDIASYPFQEQGCTPIVVETWAEVANPFQSSAVLYDVRVDCRAWQRAPNATFVASPLPIYLIPLATAIWAEKDEDGDYVQSLFSVGAPVIQTSLESLKSYVDSAMETNTITHICCACGSYGWEEAATAGTSAACRPDTDGGLLLDQEVWVDYDVAYEGGMLFVISGGGTWTIDVIVGSTYSTSTGVTASRDWGAGERTFTVSASGQGWLRVRVVATRTAGSGTFELRHFRLTEAISSLAVPADD